MAGWTPLAIGWLNMASTLATLVLSGPAGAAVDLLGRPRRMLVLACLAIVAGSLVVLPLREFWPVLASQLIVSLGGALATPSQTALTLGVVGDHSFARQFGLNQAADHAGNMAAAIAVTVLSLAIGAGAPFVVVGTTALAAIVFALYIPRRAIDEDRARGTHVSLSGAMSAPPPSSIRAVLQDWRFLSLAAVIVLFDLGNDQMLPLLGQRQALERGGNPITWMAIWIMVAQMTMVPMSVAAAWLAHRRGTTELILISCVVLALRAVLAAIVSGPWWVIVVEVMDGIGAGLISVAGPIAVTELTYGGGRTQTALGSLGALRGLAAAASALIGGAVATHVGWNAALAIMAAPPVVAIPVLIGMMRRQRDV